MPTPITCTKLLATMDCLATSKMVSPSVWFAWKETNSFFIVGTTLKQIDHVLIEFHNHSALKYLRIYRGSSIRSDNYLGGIPLQARKHPLAITWE